ncbi:hypothetical protein GQ42DRAFT_175987 [Ramicandelaber brevisporus]|nr:hypothetical protein GQ42DRAFT_175987 [Ramicandelaber brevisporus]
MEQENIDFVNLNLDLLDDPSFLESLLPATDAGAVAVDVSLLAGLDLPTFSTSIESAATAAAAVAAAAARLESVEPIATVSNGTEAMQIEKAPVAGSSNSEKMEEVEEDANAVYCICRKSDDGTPMVQCEECQEWFHFSCVKLRRAPPANRPWKCPSCRASAAKATTTSASTSTSTATSKGARTASTKKHQRQTGSASQPSDSPAIVPANITTAAAAATNTASIANTAAVVAASSGDPTNTGTAINHAQSTTTSAELKNRKRASLDAQSSTTEVVEGVSASRRSTSTADSDGQPPLKIRKASSGAKVTPASNSPNGSQASAKIGNVATARSRAAGQSPAAPGKSAVPSVAGSKISNSSNSSNGSSSKIGASRAPVATSATAVRNLACNGFFDALINDASAKTLHPSDDARDVAVRRLASAIEAAIFEAFGHDGRPVASASKNGHQVSPLYKSKSRSLLYNLKDAGNARIREALLKGDLKPAQFVAMSNEELANDELKRLAEDVREKSLLQTVKKRVDGDAKAKAEQLGHQAVEMLASSSTNAVPSAAMADQTADALRALSAIVAEAAPIETDGSGTQDNQDGATAEIADEEHDGTDDLGTGHGAAHDDDDMYLPPPLTPPPIQEEIPSWAGEFDFPLVSHFPTQLVSVGGRSLDSLVPLVGTSSSVMVSLGKIFIPPCILVDGRIPVTDCEKYLRPMRPSTTREVALALLTVPPSILASSSDSSSQPVSPDTPVEPSDIGISSVVDHLRSKQRWGVVKLRNNYVHDFYLVPVRSGEPLPDIFEYMLGDKGGVHLDHGYYDHVQQRARTDLLFALLIVFKEGKDPHASTRQSAISRPAPPPAPLPPMPIPPPAQRTTPPMLMQPASVPAPVPVPAPAPLAISSGLSELLAKISAKPTDNAQSTSQPAASFNLSAILAAASASTSTSKPPAPSATPPQMNADFASKEKQNKKQQQ